VEENMPTSGLASDVLERAEQVIHLTAGDTSVTRAVVIELVEEVKRLRLERPAIVTWLHAMAEMAETFSALEPHETGLDGHELACLVEAGAHLKRTL
jgi:hypothetical protein